MTTMSPEIFLTIVFIASVLLFFLLPLVLFNFLSDFRRLSGNSIPQPFFVLFQRSLARLIPWPAKKPESIVGRNAFLEWDFRWGPHGGTIARISGIEVESHALVLELKEPIELGKKHINNVRFHAHKARNSFGSCAIDGHLLPEIEPGWRAAATLVVYSADKSVGD